jgi:hypothetical protein
MMQVNKSRRMKWVGHEVCMVGWTGAYRVLERKPEGERPPGRPRHRWVVNIKNGSSRSWLRGMDQIDLN